MMRLVLSLAALAAMTMLLAPDLALADAGAAVTVVAPAASTVVAPYGDWINDLASLAIAVAGMAVTIGVPWLLRFLPAGIRAFITQAQIAQAEQLLNAGIGYGINQVAGASKGRQLEIPVGNAVVAEAANYVLAHGPGWLVEWMGGPDMIQQKILARLDLAAGDGGDAAPQAAAATSTGATATPAAVTPAPTVVAVG